MEGNVKKTNLLMGRIKETPQIDKTLTKDGQCADAKVVGDKLKELEKSNNISYENKNANLTSTNVKDALDELSLFKAPSGYGLGTYATGLSNVDLNYITKAGFYCFDTGVGVLHAPTSLPSILRVSPFYNDTYVEQECILIDGKGTRVRRIRHNGAWEPWEYENPPMSLYEEYRTTERYHGKPVYTKMFGVEYTEDIGNANGSYNFAIEISIPNIDKMVKYGGHLEIIGAEGFPSPNPIPFFNDAGGFMGVNYVNQGGVAVHIEKHIVKAYTPIYIQIWYTKSTD